jgi:hypothetical protein
MAMGKEPFSKDMFPVCIPSILHGAMMVGACSCLFWAPKKISFSYPVRFDIDNWVHKWLRTTTYIVEWQRASQSKQTSGPLKLILYQQQHF